MIFSDSLMVALIGILVVMVELSLLAVLIILMSKIICAITAKKTAAKTIFPDRSDTASVIAVTLPKTQSEGSLNLHNIDDKTAAMLMAIVSNESKIPLSELRFQSIKVLD